MPIPLKIVKKRDPRDITLPVKYYVSTKATGEINFEDLAHKTSEQCTVTKADCYAVLIALEENIKDALSFGQIVRFGTLGSFQISISSHGSETKEGVGLAAVKSKRILFRPDKRFKLFLKGLSFTKAGFKD
ncbi:MAG: DNA-binding protein [Lutibacter sp.]|uniref:HU family DNA-binding protein n=1 Tax=Lutibacter sp. TaxID=1925666 RepID=UPI001A0ADB9D|nr:HU family DNA-binding protein [Lutibacter sp.]NOR28131.1 DNA-binding protein [Lutibacter sp.]